jgi:hypothetical protein
VEKTKILRKEPKRFNNIGRMVYIRKAGAIKIISLKETMTERCRKIPSSTLMTALHKMVNSCFLTLSKTIQE